MSIVPADPIQAALDLRYLWTPSFTVSFRDALDGEERKQLCIDFLSRVKRRPIVKTLHQLVLEHIDKIQAERDAGIEYVEPLKFTTWEEVTAAEPRLLELEAKCKQLAPMAGPHNWPIYSAMKREWSRLVGWTAGRPEMRDSSGYEIVLDHLVDVLGF